MSRELLPIDSELPKVLEALESDGCAVVRASPGAGKTTRIPPAVERALGPAKGQIWMIEPRRMAARTAARRLAQEHGSTVGHYAGYRVRFDHKVTRDTRLVVATQGILLRHLQSNPLLEGVGAVIFDEFHERQLDVDLALAMVSQVRKTLREDLKIIVMSATLDPIPISEWLGSCPVIDCPGRQYPVEVKYSPIPHRYREDEHVVQAIEKTLSRSTGDLLVFLPGVGEIFGLQRALTSLAKRESLAVLPL
ncbi:MAG: DEAD/DEAH box helicase, partial [Planctomycetota bacterium]|nr:DEAD/DEAH box helicase [Planctomycetota bacterium]